MIAVLQARKSEDGPSPFGGGVEVGEGTLQEEKQHLIRGLEAE